MVKSKIRYKVKNWISQIRLYLGFPQIWVFAIIFILAVLMFILSLFVENEYWSTLAGNIFAGLITGMVISLIAGTKQIYIVKQEMLHSWLAELHKQIMDFYEMRNKFLRRDYGDMAREDFIYDMGAHANWANDFILQGTFDKKLPFDPERYCKNNYGYDVMVYRDRLNELKETISYSTDQLNQKEVLDLFKPVYDGLHKLNSDVCRDMNSIEIKIAAAKRSLI